jgi:hypothetical protein
MTEYRFLNTFNFWPVPHKFYFPFDMNNMINRNGDIIDIVWGPADEWLRVIEHENRSEIRELDSPDNTRE